MCVCSCDADCNTCIEGEHRWCTASKAFLLVHELNGMHEQYVQNAQLVDAQAQCIHVQGILASVQTG